MAVKIQKKQPSRLDFDVWRMALVEHKTREQIAQITGRAIPTIDYHIREAKALIGIDVSQAKSEFQHLMIPLAFDSVKLIHKAFKSGNPKYLDAAIKFLRNAGYTIETQELNVNHKDTSSPDQSFESVMQRFKSRAVDANIIEGKQAEVSEQPASNSVESSSVSVSDEATSTSIPSSSMSISPLNKSHAENPKLAQDTPCSDTSLKNESERLRRDEDY